MFGIESIIGGISGLLGGIATAIVNYKIQKLKNEHEKIMAEIELKKMDKEKEIMIAEAEASVKITQAEIEGATELAEIKGYTETHKERPLFRESYMKRLSEAKGWVKYLAWPVITIVSMMFGFVDFLKALMRPALTIYHVIITTWVTIMAWKIAEQIGGGFITQGKAVAILDQVISTVLYLTVTCVTWWFFDRRTAKFLRQMRGAK